MPFRLRLLDRVNPRGLALALLAAGALARPPAAAAQVAAKPVPAAPAAVPAGAKAAGAVKAAPPPAAKPAAGKAVLAKLPNIETFTVSNGMVVAVLRLPMVPVVLAQVWYRAGSKDEPRDRRGVAQLLARLMWKGSQRVRPDAHAQLIATLGGRVTGGTDEDSTHFGDEVPAAYLDFALMLEAERMRGLQLRDSAVKAERDQLLNELRQEESSPIARGLRRLLELSFTKHPYAWPSGGALADVPAITTADVKRFYDAYYVPNNAALIVVGDTTVEAVKAAVTKYFAPMAASPVARQTTADAEPPASTQRREVAKPGQLGLVMFGFPVPAATHPDWAALQVAATILGSGDESRIKQRLHAGPKEIGLDGGVSLQQREHPSLLIALAAYNESGGGDAVEAALLDEINKLAQRGASKEELRNAKAQLLARAIFAMEGNEGLSTQLGRSWIWYGDPKTFTADTDRLEAVTSEDIKRVLTTYLRPERSTILAIPPAAKAAKP
jgi:zinc protease